MPILADLMMFGWIPFVIALFVTLPARRAVAVAMLAAWLFLPWEKYRIQGLPEYTKEVATCWAIVFAALIFDLSQPPYKLRLRWFDLPMLAWSFSPIGASLSNGLGLYDGLAQSFTQFTVWGLPYLLGRTYFTSLRSLRELAICIVIATLVYVPFCLWEIRMSPRLHLIVYGFRPSPFGSTYRFGGYRPLVFMLNGLMLGLWMLCSALVAYWLWRSRSVRHIGRVPMGWVVAVLGGAALLCKSLGATALVLYGGTALTLTRRRRLALVILCLSVAPIGYIGVRMTKYSSLSRVVRAAEKIDPDRAQSFQFRLSNEDILVERALEKPVFGWGTWRRNRVLNEKGKDISIPDGHWVLALGRNGLFGLTSWCLAAILPLILLAVRYHPRFWSRRALAPAAVLAVVVTLYATDCLLNAMMNPLYLLAAGGVSSVAALPRPKRYKALEGAWWQEKEPALVPPDGSPR